MLHSAHIEFGEELLEVVPPQVGGRLPPQVGQLLGIGVAFPQQLVLLLLGEVPERHTQDVVEVRAARVLPVFRRFIQVSLHCLEDSSQLGYNKQTYNKQTCVLAIAQFAA